MAKPDVDAAEAVLDGVVVAWKRAARVRAAAAAVVAERAAALDEAARALAAAEVDLHEAEGALGTAKRYAFE